MTKDNSDEDQMPTTFPKKFAKALKEMPEFKDTADAASAEELKKTIILSEGNIFTIEKAKEDDTKLTATRELQKELSAPYSDAVKVQRAKIAYALFLLEGKGESIGDEE